MGGWTLRHERKSEWRKALLFAMWCSNLLLLAVTIRWSGVWPWAWVYRFIPGAEGVRVISMIQLDLMISDRCCSMQRHGGGLAVGADASHLCPLLPSCC